MAVGVLDESSDQVLVPPSWTRPEESVRCENGRRQRRTMQGGQSSWVRSPRLMILSPMYSHDVAHAAHVAQTLGPGWKRKYKPTSVAGSRGAKVTVGYEHEDGRIVKRFSETLSRAPTSSSDGVPPAAPAAPAAPVAPAALHGLPKTRRSSPISRASRVSGVQFEALEVMDTLWAEMQKLGEPDDGDATLLQLRWQKEKFLSLTQCDKFVSNLRAVDTTFHVFVSASSICNSNRRCMRLEEGQLLTYVGVEHLSKFEEMTAFYRETLYPGSIDQFWIDRFKQCVKPDSNPFSVYTACSLCLYDRDRQIIGCATFHFARTTFDRLVCYISMFARRGGDEYKGFGTLLWNEVIAYVKSVTYGASVYMLTNSVGFFYRRNSRSSSLSCISHPSRGVEGQQFWIKHRFKVDSDSIAFGMQLLVLSRSFSDDTCCFVGVAI